MAGDRLHVVVLDGRRRVVAAEVWPPSDIGGLASRLLDAGIARVAVDAPAAPSTAPHARDVALPRKFRTARCGEIALGRHERIWVSWVTPEHAPFRPWMQAGFALFAALGAAGVDVIEVYPHAAFRVLAGRRLPSKSTAAGISARVAILASAGIDEPHLAMWSHDGLDAVAAALVAVDGEARAVSCGHDGSAIWLPGYRRRP